MLLQHWGKEPFYTEMPKQLPAKSANAIDFSKAIIVAEDETFIAIPLKDIAAGSYEWVRCSLSYQNYNIKVLSSGTEYTGTLSSFVGFRNYITRLLPAVIVLR